MKEFSKYVGLDVHKETIAVSVAEAQGGEVRYLGEIANTPEAIDKLVKQLRKGSADLFFLLRGRPMRLLHSSAIERPWLGFSESESEVFPQVQVVLMRHGKVNASVLNIFGNLVIELNCV